jgi:hypothetical protein
MLNFLLQSTVTTMTAPNFYLVAGNDAFALDDDTGIVYGCYVDNNGMIDWDCAYDFDPNEEDVEYVAHMSKLVLDMAALHYEQQQNMGVFVK